MKRKATENIEDMKSVLLRLLGLIKFIRAEKPASRQVSKKKDKNESMKSYF